MSKIIWYLHPYGGSPSLGMAHRPYFLAREFDQMGHKAYVLSASFHHLLKLLPLCQSAFQLQSLEGVNYIWLKTPTYQSNNLCRLNNMIGYSLQLWRNWRQLMGITGKPDVIIASSPHLFHTYPAALIARKINAQFIVEIRDLWPLSLTELLNLPKYHPLIQVFNCLERFAYSQADQLVSLLGEAKNYFIEKGLSPEKFHHIPNGVDSAGFEKEIGNLPLELQQTLQQLKVNQIKLIGYTGALGKPNALPQLLQALAHLQQSQIPCHAILIGQGAEKSSLLQQVRLLQLNNISIFEPIAHHQIPMVLNAMDLLFIGWQNKPLYQYGISPNKLFEYMLAKKPILHATNSPDDPVQKAGCGITIPPEQPLILARAIQTLINTKQEELTQMGEQGFAYIMKHHQYQQLAKRYSEIFYL